MELDALERPDAWAETFDLETVAALRLADEVCGDTHTLDPSLMAQLRTHFTEVALAELILVAGQANLNNRVGNAAKQLLGPTAPD